MNCCLFNINGDGKMLTLWTRLLDAFRNAWSRLSSLWWDKSHGSRKMTKLSVAIMIYGEEDLSEYINEWKDFVETNSRFDIIVTEKHESELTEITYWEGYDPPCYLATRENVDYDAIPKHNHIITLLWKLLAGQEACLAGGTWGGDYGIHDRPYTTVPYDAWWFDEDYTHEGFNKHGAQIITHEFQNALRWIIHTELGFPADTLPDPYAGDCDGMTLAECYISIFNAITDEMYSAIDSIFKRDVTFMSVPDGAAVSVDV